MYRTSLYILEVNQMGSKKWTRIYALMRNRQVFVGRSSSVRLSAVVYSHCRGEHEQTQPYFDLYQKRPDLYVLAEIEDASPITYRHWLAWIQAFESAGYKLLNREDVLEDSRDLHPETRQIYEQIMRIPLEMHLVVGHCTSFSAYDSVPHTPSAEESSIPATNPHAATEKLSIRLSKQEKELISSFAKSMNLSLRDALQYAINRVMFCNDAALAADQGMYLLRERYSQDVDKLKRKNLKLTNQLQKQHQETLAKQEIHSKKIQAIRTDIQKYLTYLEPNTRIPLHIEQSSYKDYMHDTEIVYEYPSNEGFAVMRLHAILWGNSQAVRFLVGVTDQGETIKLRYYPSNSFIGMFPTNEAFGLRGSCWLVGWESKEEDVMQLFFCLPLSVRPKYDDPMAVGTEWDRLMWEIDQNN